MERAGPTVVSFSTPSQKRSSDVRKATDPAEGKKTINVRRWPKNAQVTGSFRKPAPDVEGGKRGGGLYNGRSRGAGCKSNR